MWQALSSSFSDLLFLVRRRISYLWARAYSLSSVVASYKSLFCLASLSYKLLMASSSSRESTLRIVILSSSLVVFSSLFRRMIYSFSIETSSLYYPSVSCFLCLACLRPILWAAVSSSRASYFRFAILSSSLRFLFYLLSLASSNLDYSRSSYWIRRAAALS